MARSWSKSYGDNVPLQIDANAFPSVAAVTMSALAIHEQLTRHVSGTGNPHYQTRAGN